MGTRGYHAPRTSLEFTIVRLRDATGRMEGMAAVLRDVTQRFEELRALRRELAAARGGAGGPKPRTATAVGTRRPRGPATRPGCSGGRSR